MEREEVAEWAKQIPQPDGILSKMALEWKFNREFISYSMGAAKWRHFEQMKEVPNNFVTLGDALAAFNPLWGQGMTHAAKQAVILDSVLVNQKRFHSGEGWWYVPQQFYREATEVTKVCWDMGVPADLVRPTTKGTRNFGTWLNAIVGEVLLTNLLSSKERFPDFAALQQMTVPSEEILSKPAVLFPLLLGVSKELLERFRNRNKNLDGTEAKKQ